MFDFFVRKVRSVLKIKVRKVRTNQLWFTSCLSQLLFSLFRTTRMALNLVRMMLLLLIQTQMAFSDSISGLKTEAEFNEVYLYYLINIPRHNINFNLVSTTVRPS